MKVEKISSICSKFAYWGTNSGDKGQGEPGLGRVSELTGDALRKRPENLQETEGSAMEPVLDPGAVTSAHGNLFAACQDDRRFAVRFAANLFQELEVHNQIGRAHV